jgi:hypothetical protein
MKPLDLYQSGTLGRLGHTTCVDALSDQIQVLRQSRHGKGQHDFPLQLFSNLLPEELTW